MLQTSTSESQASHEALTLIVNVLPPTLFRASRTTTLTPDSDSNLAADKPTRKRGSALKQVAAISHINGQKWNQSFKVRNFNTVL